MPFTITSSKTKTPAKIASKIAAKVSSNAVSEAVNKAKELADIIIAQHLIIQKAKDPKKLQDAARKELIELVSEDYSDTEEIIITGTQGVVKFGEKSLDRKVKDAKRLHELIGDEAFYALCNPSVTKIDEYLTPVQKSKVLEVKRGSRTMSILPKSAGDAEA